MSSIASASTTNGQEPPLKKKKKKKKPSTQPTTIPSLPDDVIVSCLARVSRLYYPTLSKNFRSLLASLELYYTRKHLDRTEYCLYVCLQFPSDPDPHWFTLSRRPDQTLTNHTYKKGKKKKKKTKKKAGRNVLASIRICNSPTSEWSNLVAVGHNLYAINKSIEDPISFIDCRTHTWLEAPRMRIAHTDSEFDGDMYLPGSYENLDSLNCIEVFNSKTQTWNPVPPEKRIFKSENMEGKIYMDFDGVFGKDGFVYNPKELTVEPVGWDSDEDSNGLSACVIQNIMYCYSKCSGKFTWIDSKIDIRGNLKGLEGLPKFARYSNVRLVDFGGKLVVLWDKYVHARGGCKEKMIWCAVVSLEKCNNCEEISGKVEWFDAVLRVPKSYKYVCAIAATV